jgi:hypothetical protein
MVRFDRIAVVAGGLTLVAGTALAQGVPGGPHADSLYQAKMWPQAAVAYGKAAAADPGNPRLWYRLGVAEHSQQHFDKAEKAFARASTLPAPAAVGGLKGFVFYNLAAARARLGKTEAALTALDSALQNGRFPPSTLEGDEDFAGLKADARFAARLKAARLAFFPCDTIPHARDLDFWIGEWEVYTPAKQRAGHNSVQRILEGCVLLENWTGAMGSSGKSFNWFNTMTGEWQQTWVADQASSLEYRGGKLEGNTMWFLADTRTATGEPAKSRLSFTRLDQHKVRQLFEQSTDGGKTWTPTTDLIYVREGSGVEP